MTQLTGCRAVIVGGTHGMGFATAQLLIERGAEVIVTGANPERAAAARAALGDRATVIRSDAADLAAIDRLADDLQDNRPLDALLVFAAIAEFAPFDQVTEDQFDRQFAVNAKGAFFTVQRLAPLLCDGGSITLTTVTPATASPMMAVYLATKAAVRAYAGAMAAELLPRRIRVNTLAPGFVDTPTLGVVGMTAAERQELMAMGDRVTPMRRHGTPDEIARAALFLAFDATFTTGIDLPVDGGLSQIDAPVA